MQSLVGSLISKWGQDGIAWERPSHCPYVSNKGNKCMERPVAQCPTCGGIGILYDPPLYVSGLFRNPEVRVRVLNQGQALESVPTLLLSPADAEQRRFLEEGVFKLYTGKVELKDRFTVRGVVYVADGPATPPTLAGEQLAWRIPLKRVIASEGGG